MKDFRLELLTLRNFKGVADFCLDARGDDREVRGDNATGKTTIRDAVFWLTTGKDSAGRSNFEVKTLKPDGEPIHGLEHEVSGVFVNAEGGKLALQRTYHEDWQKKRGQAEREFTGHTTEYVINEVPVQKKEYDAVVAETLGGERELRLLMDPEYFSDGLPWKDRRRQLLEVCGDFSDDDVIASSEALTDLGPLLAQVSPEALRAGGGDRCDALRRTLTAAKRTANTKLGQIPVRIDEVNRALGTVDEIDVDALTSRQEELAEQLDGLGEARTQLAFGGAVAAARGTLSSAEMRLNGARAEARGERDEAAQEIYLKLAGARALFDTADRKVTLREGSLRDHIGAVDDTGVKIRTLEYTRESIESGEFEGETICPACGEPLKPEKLEAARGKFNKLQASKLREVDDKLDVERIALEAIRLSVTEARTSVDAATNTRNDASALKALLAIQHDEAAGKDFEVPGELQTAVDEAASALEAARGGAEDELSGVDSKIATAKAEREANALQLAQVERALEAAARIRELQSEQRRLAGQFEEYERQLYMTEEFVRRKVSLLEDRINERFTVAQFKLFVVQVQGGLVECCETTVDGVPFGTNLNHGARVLVGLEIIDVLQRHFEKRLPVFVDQAESITTLPPMDCQMIRLVVDANARELVVSEVVGRTVEAP